MIGYLFSKSNSNNKDFETKNSSNINLDLIYYKKYFKKYEWALILVVCYISLSCKNYGLSHLVMYYLFMTLPIISCIQILNQISVENYGEKVKSSNIFICNVFGVDNHLINNIPNRFVKFHLFNKFFITLLAPIIIYAVQ